MAIETGISFIIPTYNENVALKETVSNIIIALNSAKVVEYEVIIVDDGSDIPISTLDFTHPSCLRILRQQNLGRLVARLNGLHNANYDDVIFIDSRVLIHQDSISNLVQSITESMIKPGMVVGNIQFPESTNLIGLFWDSITQFVWFRFHNSNSDLRLSIENFDQLPKGTTLLYSEKSLLLSSYEKLTESQLKSKDTNDDTLLIKEIVNRAYVICSKKFLATYTPRTTLYKFLRHAHHRGRVASQGYFATGSTGRKISMYCAALLLLCSLLAVYQPKITMFILFILFILFESLFLFRTSVKHTISFNLYVFPFLIFYTSGVMYKSISVRKK